MKKTAPIKIMVTPTIKKKLLDKAKENNLNLTQFIEKIAVEPIVFVDKNVRNLVDMMGMGKIGAN